MGLPKVAGVGVGQPAVTWLNGGKRKGEGGGWGGGYLPQQPLRKALRMCSPTEYNSESSMG